MVSNSAKVFNASELILQHLEDIKEAFISYYGEDSREFIEDKFRHLDILSFVKPVDVSPLTEKVESELKERAIIEAINQTLESYKEDPAWIRNYLDFMHKYGLKEEGRKQAGISEEIYQMVDKRFAAWSLQKLFTNMSKEINENNIEQLQSEGRLDFLEEIIEKLKEQYKNYDALPAWVKNYSEFLHDYKVKEKGSSGTSYQIKKEYAVQSLQYLFKNMSKEINPDNIEKLQSEGKLDFLEKLIEKTRSQNKSPYDQLLEYFGNRKKNAFIYIPEHLKNYFEFLRDYKLKEEGKISETTYEISKQMACSDTITFLCKMMNIDEINVDNIEQLQREGKLDFLRKIMEEYHKILEKAEEEIGLSRYIEEEKKNSERKPELEKKYMIELIKEFLPNELEGFLNQNAESINKVALMIGQYLNSEPLSMWFTEDYDKMLLSDCPEWKKEQIKKRRIAFFKMCEIDLGDEYEAYERNEECKKIRPNSEYVKNIMKKKKEFLNKFNNEYYGEMSEYKELEKKVRGLRLIADSSYLLKSYISSTYAGFCATNAMEENGTIVVNPTVFICDDSINCLDGVVIHEINHAIETGLAGKTGKGLLFTCGWLPQVRTYANDVDTSTIDVSVNSELNLDINTNTRMFNEVVNELLSKEITKRLHAKDHHIFAEKGKESYSASSYLKYAFLVNNFFNEYLNDIIISRRNSNINHIFEVVGQENFLRLNDLINRCVDYGIPKEGTAEYDEIIRERDEILQNMREYSKENSHHL